MLHNQKLQPAFKSKDVIFISYQRARLVLHQRATCSVTLTTSLKYINQERATFPKCFAWKDLQNLKNQMAHQDVINNLKQWHTDVCFAAVPRQELGTGLCVRWALLTPSQHPPAAAMALIGTAESSGTFPPLTSDYDERQRLYLLELLLPARL